MIDITEGSSFLKMCVGIGSISQDFDLNDIIMVFTSDSVIGVNWHNFGVPLSLDYRPQCQQISQEYF